MGFDLMTLILIFPTKSYKRFKFVKQPFGKKYFPLHKLFLNIALRFSLLQKHGFYTPYIFIIMILELTILVFSDSLHLFSVNRISSCV